MSNANYLRAAMTFVALAVTATTFAQNDTPRRRIFNPPGNAPRAAQGERTAVREAGHSDSVLANWLIIDNQNEITLAQLANQRAQSPEVKEFAQKMVNDHKQMLEKLQRFAGTQPATREANDQEGNARNDAPRSPATAREAADQEKKARENEANPNPPADRDATARREPIPSTSERPFAPGLNLVALKRELGAQCLQSVQRELEAKEGAEFDKCFMHMQVGMHIGAVDTMTVFQNHASGELRQTLNEGIQTAQGHLKSAKELSKKVDGVTAETARRETTKRN